MALCPTEPTRMNVVLNSFSELNSAGGFGSLKPNKLQYKLFLNLRLLANEVYSRE